MHEDSTMMCSARPNLFTLATRASSACALICAVALTACASGRNAAPAPSPPSPPSPYDLLIRNGHIIDGTGSPWYAGDVAIEGDRIAAIGVLTAATARDTIDATGLTVTPGWIDVLGHSEYPQLADGRALSKITQGITSEVTGEVFSVVPVNERTLKELPFARGHTVDWTDLNGYFERFQRHGSAINLGTFVAEGSVRRYVMGDVDRAPTAAELEQMKAQVAKAMQQGALGLSTGMIYTPSSFAETDEIVALAKVAAQYGGGYASHIRSEGARLVEAVQEAISIGEQAGTWVQIHHIKASGKANWGKMPLAIAAIDEARARGVDVTADQYPYRASSTDLETIIPNWAKVGGTDSLIARLQDPATRRRLEEEIMPGGRVELIGESSGGPTGVMVAGFRTDSLKHYAGMFLSDVAKARQQRPIDALFDILIADSAATGAIFFSMSEDDIEYAMKQPYVMVGMDAGARAMDSAAIAEHPHPRAFGSFPRILCHYVRDRHVITLPDAIRKFSALPAARMGLQDRGVLKAGMKADITIFDAATVCDRATFDEPVQPAVGIRHVLVNGVPVLRNGAVTEARPGQPLRR
jgi:dihydroorotase/N-acyl-D-amino-acid deacylase